MLSCAPFILIMRHVIQTTPQNLQMLNLSILYQRAKLLEDFFTRLLFYRIIIS